MAFSWKSLVLMAVLLAGAGIASPARCWNLVLPDTVVLDQDLALLGDVAKGPVPAAVQNLVIRAGMLPNSSVSVSRQDILRRLVTAGLSGGVKISGASHCQVVFQGCDLEAEDIENEVRRIIQPLVPPSFAGAPDTWFELELADTRLAVADKWRAETDRIEPLEPGRNLVRIEIVSGDRRQSFAVAAILHRFGEVARVRNPVSRDSSLDENMFDWQWRDLAEVPSGWTVGRASIQGNSPTRNLKPGDYLRQADLSPTPVILAGDSVELRVRRGQVAVTVRALARQNGCLGQTIPVRSELTGKLVNARVAGPGLVEWRR